MAEANVHEFGGFMNVKCCECGREESISLDGWVVELRSEVILRTTMDPTTYVCEGCGKTIIVTMTLKPQLSTELYQYNKKEKLAQVL